MISIYKLKSAFQTLLRPVVDKLAERNVTANQVTLAAVALSGAGGAAIALFPAASWPYLLLPPVLFLRMALNAIDGMLAREHHMQSKLGALLNELGDVVSDTLLYLPFTLMSGISGGWVVAVVILAILSEMTGVIGAQIGGSRRYDGPFGKSDRAFAFGTLGLLTGLHIFPVGVWMNSIFAAMCGLLVFTIYNRGKNALKESA
jgi:CDP-diacylglycerol--glycerol-3-phosphate 3-phosphatidyltransferase